MTLGTLDRKTLLLLGAGVLTVVIVRLNFFPSEQPQVVAASPSIPAAAKRLARVRQLAAALPSRARASKELSAALAEREKGMIQADTLAQAQAQLLQIMRRLSEAQSPPIEIRTVEVGQSKPLGESYGEVSVPLSFECRIEQLVNLLAEMSAQPELLAISDLRISQANPKDKTMNVRLIFSGVVPRKLVPEKRGPGLL